MLALALASAGLCAMSGAYAATAKSGGNIGDQAAPDQSAPADTATARNQAARERKKADNAKLLNSVQVTGFRASVESAIATKRDNSNIVEVITAEDIGKLPDVSIAESLSRLPGLTAQRVNGRSQVISIRGLGPDLSTGLLNGREQVTTGDNRGVEFDQYPAELMGSVVVYKTPDATLIGQGLAGTVDMRTLRPLDQDKRILSANARYEFNGDSSLNPDVKNHGYRASATYVDQFANRTLGVTFGVAAQKTPTQEEMFNAWGYPSVSDGGPLVIGGSKDYVASNELNRVGVMGTIEYKPSDNFHSVLDLSYSDFEEEQRLRGIEFPLFWSSAVLRPGYTVDNGLVTDGVYDNVKAVVRNDYNDRKAKLYNAGWNNKFKFNEDWSAEADVSYSRATRHDMEMESYSGTGPAGSGATDSLAFSLQPNGLYRFTPSLDYSNGLVLTDPQGWGSGAQPNPLTQAGFINSPNTTDELKSLRLSVDRSFESGPISDIVLGGNYSDRNKKRTIGQEFLTLPDGATSAPIPSAALLGSDVGLTFLGIPSQVTYDPLYLLNNGYYTPVSVALSSFAVPQDWKVREKVTTGFLKFNLDTYLGSMPLTGNFGVQVVHTDQTSQGSTIQTTTNSTTGNTEAAFVPVKDGAKYNNFLPSLNLILDMTDQTKLRFGVARTLARARMDQLNASKTLGHDITKLTSTDPNLAFFSATGGNARLKPTLADGVDLSLEHYFHEGKGYMALAGYYKKLRDFVNPNDAYLYDFSAYVDQFLSPDQQAQLGTTQGIVSGPTNRGKGNIKGVEGTVSLPFDVFTPVLDGFGLITSGSYTKSSVKLGDSPDPITVPGLSKWVMNSTLYFEKQGFQVRVSRRHRSDFLGEVQGISATRTLRTVKGGSIYDAQVSYDFTQGRLKGLTLLAQASNMTNEPFVTFQNDDSRQVIDHQSYGRTYLVGASYKF